MPNNGLKSMPLRPCTTAGILLFGSCVGSALFGGLHHHARAQPAANVDDDENPYRSGLIARYVGSDGVEHTRLEEQVSFSWGDTPPDRRVPAGSFQATFQGHLLIQTPGKHRLRAFTAGKVRLTLDGEPRLEHSSRQANWLDSEWIDLPFGYHRLEVEYRRTDEAARIALFWEGPQFGLEPLAARWLFHEKQVAAHDGSAIGQRWVRALRCAACHDIAGEPPALPAPALDRLAGNISRSWLVNRLSNQVDAESRQMPHFNFDRQQAEAIAEYLFSVSDKTRPMELPAPTIEPVAEKSNPNKKRDKTEPAAVELEPPSATKGSLLFRSLGCLACHRVGELGTDGLFGGGDLSKIGSKRSADFFARWLTDPAGINRDHRMPLFRLNTDEVGHLAAYLQTLLGEPEPVTKTNHTSGNLGRELVVQWGCAACHALPKSESRPTTKKLAKFDLTALEDKQKSCLFESDPARHRPGYRLDAKERQAVAAFIADVARVKNGASTRSGQELLIEKNCLACHARGLTPGLAVQLPLVAEADPKLREVLPALLPPALIGLGDKLQDDALAASICAAEPPRQAWLRVRMPKFPLTEDETRTLVRYFIDSDRIPERSDAPRSDAPDTHDTALEAAGPRLVTADGFGCTSCHAIGKWKPEKVALNAMGADLSMIGSRVRRAWFDRWVRNPARIAPQMEMPAVQQSVRGVLDGKLDRQLSAVWQVLNRKAFTPPSPHALRVVRRSNLPGTAEPAAVLTDLIEVHDRTYVKPLIIGLPNRHNVLFDLATSRLAAWWIGDTARQRTRGKSWYWEAGAPQLLAAAKKTSPGESDLFLIEGRKQIPPLPDGEYVTAFDRFEHIPFGLEFAHRLRFQVGEQKTTVAVVQQFLAISPHDTGEASGFRRRLRIEPSAGSSRFEFVALPGDVTIDQGGKTATLVGRAEIQIVLRSPNDAKLKKTPQGAILQWMASHENSAECELEYRCDILPDHFVPLPVVDRSVDRVVLNVVPGFEAIRLPITDQAMPTGLAWHDDGTLVVSSLEGRVWLGHDTDGDGLEDKLLPFSDDLAAPFGVATSGAAIDVINKYGLLRLEDRNQDGHADHTQLLASGWGHTRDYHDWAVGLPRDVAGNYYVSLPCQQDDRSEAGALLRGTVVKLTPREPTPDDPRAFNLDPVCGGLRFPQGIALSRAGDLFVTDNQGNYTPFNELNHVVRGARYGFINQLESQQGLNPPFQFAAVEIPHPWTRSVNGICFLEMPSPTADTVLRKPFGPFTGHLIGCEYDTRRLVRISLERIGDDFQGAVYPLSMEPAEGQETFEGPLVCQVSPRGDVYIGNIRDSGWGAGANTGSLVRLRWRGELPPGIAEIRTQRNGFVIDFTANIERVWAGNPANYAISSYRRIPSPAYGAPDSDARVEGIKSIRVSEDGKRSTIELDGLREGFVYEFHLRNLTDSTTFFPSEAYYTLRHRAN